jgi:hypothetical protein
MFPLPEIIVFMTMHGPVIDPHTTCLIRIENDFEGRRTPVTLVVGEHPSDAPGPSFEYPCAGEGAGRIYSPAQNVPWDGRPCNAPDRPGCSICDSADYKEQWFLQAGDALRLPLEGVTVEIFFLDPCYVPPPCTSPCSMIDPDNPGHPLIYDPSFSGFYKKYVIAGSPVDINLDGDIGTDADIEEFFNILGRTGYDYNYDGDIGTDRDISDFFAKLAGR